ncbi:MAG: RraA family protein [Spirochaetia bacterium]|nr:RraA family protein [Spirochaetia bacterium]MCF7940606.1 RraA family protein [Spirochaetia bacterium]
MKTYEIPITELCDRYSRLYSASVGDILDRRGFRNQILPHDIQAQVRPDSAICGLAFTGEGEPHNDSELSDQDIRITMLESIFPNSISIWKTNGDTAAAHWGEIMGTAAQQKGCKGVILDGGTRDVAYLNEIEFPVFCRFRNPASSIGRWSITRYMRPIVIGNTNIFPYDVIIADIDGVVVVPQDIAYEVLQEAERVCSKEEKMRLSLMQGTSISSVYAQYGDF